MSYKRTSVPYVQTVIMVVAFVCLGAFVLIVISSIGDKTRDGERLSAMHSLQTFLALYSLNNNGNYPTSLSKLVPLYIPALPVDPLSKLSSTYTYAAIGTSTSCLSYHLGITLEDTSNNALKSDVDAAPQPVCAGSAPDFNGLSSVAAGNPCGLDVASAHHQAESCYDLTP